MPRADAGDQVVKAADNDKPVIAAGPQMLEWLQDELLLDRLIADLGWDIGDDQVNRLDWRALQADAPDRGHVRRAVERRVIPRVAHRKEVTVERNNLRLGELARQHDPDDPTAAAHIDDVARLRQIDRAQE